MPDIYLQYGAIGASGLAFFGLGWWAIKQLVAAKNAHIADKDAMSLVAREDAAAQRKVAEAQVAATNAMAVELRRLQKKVDALAANHPKVDIKAYLNESES